MRRTLVNLSVAAVSAVVLAASWAGIVHVDAGGADAGDAALAVATAPLPALNDGFALSSLSSGLAAATPPLPGSAPTADSGALATVSAAPASTPASTPAATLAPPAAATTAPAPKSAAAAVATPAPTVAPTLVPAPAPRATPTPRPTRRSRAS